MRQEVTVLLQDLVHITALAAAVAVQYSLGLGRNQTDLVAARVAVAVQEMSLRLSPQVFPVKVIQEVWQQLAVVRQVRVVVVLALSGVITPVLT
jgi:hypothetical protein